MEQIAQIDQRCAQDQYDGEHPPPPGGPPPASSGRFPKAFVWGLWESVGLGALGLALLASMVLLGWEFTVTEPLVLLAVQALGGAGLTLWAG